MEEFGWLNGDKFRGAVGRLEKNCELILFFIVDCFSWLWWCWEDFWGGEWGVWLMDAGEDGDRLFIIGECALLLNWLWSEAGDTDGDLVSSIDILLISVVGCCCSASWLWSDSCWLIFSIVSGGWFECFLGFVDFLLCLRLDLAFSWACSWLLSQYSDFSCCNIG